MVTRIMSAYFKVGRDSARVPTNFNSWSSETFGYIYPQANECYQQINYHVNVQDDHARLCHKIAGASTVLLKNVKNTLPLKKPKSIAVIREDAHDNPGGPNCCGDRGCNQGTLAMGWGSGTANFPHLIAPNTALKAQAASLGTKYANVSDNYNLAAVTAAVQGTDAAIVFANADSGEAYISVDGNTGDRNDTNKPDNLLRKPKIPVLRSCPITPTLNLFAGSLESFSALPLNEYNTCLPDTSSRSYRILHISRSAVPTGTCHFFLRQPLFQLPRIFHLDVLVENLPCAYSYYSQWQDI